MKKFVGILITLFIIMTFSGYTQQEEPDLDKALTDLDNIKYKVYVDITCDDKNTKTLVKSHIHRELRSLGDVQIVTSLDMTDMTASYGLNIVASELKNKLTGQKFEAIAISVVTVKYLTSPLDPMISGDLSKETLETILKDIIEKMSNGEKSNVCIPVHHSTYLEAGQLPTVCKNAVANFDVDILQTKRENTQNLLKIIRNRR